MEPWDKGVFHTFPRPVWEHPSRSAWNVKPWGKGALYQAEILFIFRSHGRAETESAKLAEQTSKVVAFCNLPVPAFPPPGCQSQGLVDFPATGAPRKP